MDVPSHVPYVIIDIESVTIQILLGHFGTWMRLWWFVGKRRIEHELGNISPGTKKNMNKCTVFLVLKDEGKFLITSQSSHEIDFPLENNLTQIPHVLSDILDRRNNSRLFACVSKSEKSLRGRRWPRAMRRPSLIRPIIAS